MPHSLALQMAARGWLGTPFHHQGRRKGAGCDCIGLLLGTMEEAGFHSRFRDEEGRPIPIRDFDSKAYSRDPSQERLKERLDQHFTVIPESLIAPGDVLLFRFHTQPQHVAIVCQGAGALTVIHAYQPAGKVVENLLSLSWRRRISGAYRIPPQCFKEV